MGDLLRIALPLTTWLASFSAIYGLNGWLCAAGPQGLAGRGILLAAAAAALMLQALALGWVLKSSTPRLRMLVTTLAVVALTATVWTLLPGLFLTRCT
ncbi:hypothetical protein [Paracoccus zeaxanthinifaciens]|uniref:hypothetical protein n=1 Tax=Paracoccus zeaxanthinifaciens TaxID=187400 RepID=UPI0003B6617F|nr:hypothetical protein [Paracoccus zeaxanthinifaciens]